jgi:hypothetical protein
MESGITVAVALVGGIVAGTLFAVWRDRQAEPGLPELELPAAGAGPDARDVFALSRVIASEEPQAPRLIQIAVGWAVRNEADRRSSSIFRLVTGSSGEYGSQNDGGHTYVTSARLPTPEHQDLASAIAAGAIDDPTDGATNFDSPRAQRAALARGLAGYKRTPEEVATARRRNGMELVLLEGIPEERFRLWRYA